MIIGRRRIGPQLEEHERVVPHPVPSEDEAVVLPVSEADGPVDVLICQVQPSADCNVAVYYADLAVVTVIEFGIQSWPDRIEGNGLYPVAPEGLVVVARQCGDASHVIVHQKHLHALRDLSLEDLKDRIPEDALLVDEVLHQDELLCLLQLLQEDREARIAQRIVLDTRVSEHPALAQAADIAGELGVVIGEHILGSH